MARNVKKFFYPRKKSYAVYPVSRLSGYTWRFLRRLSYLRRLRAAEKHSFYVIGKVSRYYYLEPSSASSWKEFHEEIKDNPYVVGYVRADDPCPDRSGTTTPGVTYRRAWAMEWKRFHGKGKFYWNKPEWQNNLWSTP